MVICLSFSFFFFNPTATTEIYTLSLHDALPIYRSWRAAKTSASRWSKAWLPVVTTSAPASRTLRKRSEEHTSELQSRLHLVCRLLLEKKNKKSTSNPAHLTISTINPLLSIPH